MDSIPHNLSAEQVDSGYRSWKMQEVLCFVDNILYIQLLVLQAVKFLHKTFLLHVVISAELYKQKW